MFIRKKGAISYLVENHRIDGKVRQTIIACLGREGTIEGRIYELTPMSTPKLEHKPVAWDHRKRFPRSWQKRRKFLERKLGLKDAFWVGRKETSVPYSVYAEYREEKIDSYMQEEHAKEVARQAAISTKVHAYCEKELAKLWSLIPVERHAEVKAAIEQRQKERREILRQSEARLSQLAVQLNQTRT